MDANHKNKPNYPTFKANFGKAGSAIEVDLAIEVVEAAEEEAVAHLEEEGEEHLEVEVEEGHEAV